MFLINLNGKLLNEKNGVVSVNNRSFRYGDGCFETIRMVKGMVPLWHYHWQRLATSLQVLHFELPPFFTSSFLLQAILDLASKNNHEKQARIRLTVFRGNGGLYDPENHFPNYLIQTWHLHDATPMLNTNGLISGIYPGGFKAADALANLKSNNFLLYAMAALHTRQQGWNEALVLNHKGSIADATIANLFIIKGNTILTPPLLDGPVAGTMRRYLLENLPLIGYAVQEVSIFLEDLLVADEVFLTNAFYGIKWVQQLEEKKYHCHHSVILYQMLIQPLFQLSPV